MHAMRSLALALVLAPSLVSACDSTPAKPDAAKPDAAKPDAATPDASAEAAPTPEPKPLAPAPEGAVILDGIYVQICAAEGDCPPLHQDAGAAHCAGLSLGGMTWRLPSLAELERGVGHAELSRFEGFHWSGTAWNEDPAQFWIFDPTSGSKTTAKPDRKPFTIRCVAEPPRSP